VVGVDGSTCDVRRYRGGSTDELVSIRFHTIVAGSAAPAFVVTKISRSS
jgi:hypothetical protein